MGIYRREAIKKLEQSASGGKEDEGKETDALILNPLDDSHDVSIWLMIELTPIKKQH